MIERLKLVMSHFGLTPSTLADTVGVPRSSVSHLLTGRNKPSLDFVLKLIKAYPDVNLYWLLNGKGSFPSNSEENAKEVPPTLFVESKPKSPVREETKATATSTSAPKFEKDSAKEIKRIVFFFEDGSFEAYETN